jgi:hypothetical protein
MNVTVPPLSVWTWLYFTSDINVEIASEKAEMSQWSGLVADNHKIRFWFSVGVRKFSVLQSFQTDSGAHTVPRVPDPGVMRPKRDADCSLPCSAGIKNV